jgi:hypothetical protein
MNIMKTLLNRLLPASFLIFSFSQLALAGFDYECRLCPSNQEPELTLKNFSAGLNQRRFCGYTAVHFLAIEEKWDLLKDLVKLNPNLTIFSENGEDVISHCLRCNAITSLSIIYNALPNECEALMKILEADLPVGQLGEVSSINEACTDSFLSLSKKSNLLENWNYFKKKTCDQEFIAKEREILKEFHKLRVDFLLAYDRAKQDSDVHFFDQMLPLEKLILSHPINSPGSQKEIATRSSKLDEYFETDGSGLLSYEKYNKLMPSPTAIVVIPYKGTSYVMLEGNGRLGALQATQFFRGNKAPIEVECMVAHIAPEKADSINTSLERMIVELDKRK